MDKKEIERLKEKLVAERERIAESMRRFASELDFGDDTDHGEEEADEAEETANFLSVKQSQDKRLEQIDSALERIKNGTFGACAECGKSIEKEILNIDPESLLCKSCKMKERKR